MLTGKVPFDAPTSVEIMRRHLHDPLESPAALNPRLSPGAVQIVEKLLAKKPEERYRNAREVSVAIERLLAGDKPQRVLAPAGAAPARPAERSRRKFKRRGSGEQGCLSMLLVGVGLVLALSFAVRAATDNWALIMAKPQAAIRNQR